MTSGEGLPRMTTPEPDDIVLDDVRVLADSGMALKCHARGREVWIGKLQILPGSTVHAAGDYGRLVIPLWLASELGLDGAS